MTTAPTADCRPPTQVRIKAPLPLSVSSFLLQALGTAYPDSVLIPDEGYLTVQIPDASLLVSTDDLITPEILTAALDDSPDTQGFFQSFKGGATAGVEVPKWLAVLLTQVTDRILAAADPPNYLAIDVNSVDRAPFTWIICRPGRPSPHDLRVHAEARVETLEQQLRDAGIEPIAARGSLEQPEEGSP